MLASTLIQTSHGFFTRDVENEVIVKQLGAKKLVTAQQIHSSIAMYVDKGDDYVGDALVTDKPGIAIGVYTADCAPVLLHDKEAGVVAAVHAGWRGARYDVIRSSVNLMKNMSAKNIVAVIGPSIQQRSYEVGIDLITSFRQESRENEKFFSPSQKEGHFMFNLPGYVQHKLKLSGVEKIEMLDNDTLSDEKQFCSYRRDTLAGIKGTGRQISSIVL